MKDRCCSHDTTITLVRPRYKTSSLASSSMSSHCFETRCDERWADMTEKPRTLHAHMVATCQSQEMPNLRRALLFVLLNINSGQFPKWTVSDWVRLESRDDFMVIKLSIYWCQGAWNLMCYFLQNCMKSDFSFQQLLSPAGVEYTFKGLALVSHCRPSTYNYLLYILWPSHCTHHANRYQLRAINQPSVRCSGVPVFWCFTT